MSANLAPAALTLGDAARIMREALRDRSYRSSPLGLEVARYYRWKKNEWGAEESTLRDYEAILRNLCVHFADLELKDFAPPVGTERLRECIDHYWGDASARTKNKVRSVYVDFFEWAGRERGLYGNSARAIARSKTRDTEKELFGKHFVERALTAQAYPADFCGAMLILKYAVRRGGLANAQLKHFDWDLRHLTVHTKGGRIFPLPIPEEIFWTKLLELHAHGLGPDSFLMYHRDTRRMKVPLDDAEEVLDLGNGQQQGYAWVTRRHHDKKSSGKLVHRWWYRCLEAADLVPKGTTAGQNMHRGRHTSITNILRSSHNLKLAQDFAGHMDIGSTAGYSHLDTEDLASAILRAYAIEDD